MGELAEKIGGKVAGELIRSEDWNALVTAIEELETVLSARIDGVEAQVSALDNRIAETEADLAELATRVEPLFDRYRVNLRTARVSYVLGEAAEITVELRDLVNEKIPFTPANRPWIDLVTPWGKLAAAPGVESLGGAGSRAISVRANTDGIARAILRAEVVDADEDAEAEVSASLGTMVGGKTIAQNLITASTPAEAKSTGTFQVLTEHYDNPSAKRVKGFVDSYYASNATKVTGKIVPPFTQRWYDHRATVVAVAKNDSDPLTPDSGRGVSSIQVTFRDWIGPWLILDYVNPLETIKLVPQITAQFTPKVTGDPVQSILLLKDGVKDVVREEGLVGKLRDYMVVGEALDQLSVPQHGDIVPQVAGAVKHAVMLQQMLETAEVATAGVAEKAALDAFAETSVKADSSVADVLGQVQTLQATVGKVDAEFSSMQEKVGSLDGKVTTTLGTTIQQLDSELKTVSGKVEVLKELDPTSVRSKLVEIDGLNNRLAALEKG